MLGEQQLIRAFPYSKSFQMLHWNVLEKRIDAFTERLFHEFRMHLESFGAPPSVTSLPTLDPMLPSNYPLDIPAAPTLPGPQHVPSSADLAEHGTPQGDGGPQRIRRRSSSSRRLSAEGTSPQRNNVSNRLDECFRFCSD